MSADPPPDIPPNLFAHFAAAVCGMTADSLALVTDFDGTLSEFVPDMETAAIHPAALPPLRRLASRLPLTAVMSGRAALDLRRRIGIDGVVYVGNHGAEQIVDGVLTETSGAESAEYLLQEILETLAQIAADPGLTLENKRYSASLHYRRAEDKAGVIERLQSALPDISDMFNASRINANPISANPNIGEFELFWGNNLIEIRRRNSVNKGVALDRLLDAYRPEYVIFMGDDTTDADALRALRERKAWGAIGGFGVAVIQDGTPASVLQSADYSIDGVPDAARFLAMLDAALG